MIVVEKSESGPGHRRVPLMFVPKSAASSSSTSEEESSGNLKRKRAKVGSNTKEEAKGGSNTTTAEVGSQAEIDQMMFDTGEFFYDLGWNDREVIVFIINHQTQFVNQLTLQEELNLIDEALVEAVVEAVVEALADGEEEEEVGGDGPAGDGP